MKPKRTPDFSWSVWEFWLEPEMVMSSRAHEDRLDNLVDIDTLLYYTNSSQKSPDLMREEIQNAYHKYIDSKVEEILLGSETESKLD